MSLPDEYFRTLLTELTRGLPRQGPGSSEATLRALTMVGQLPRKPRILDVGCGAGAQTIDLARATGGDIIALDISDALLGEVEERAEAAGVAHQITTLRQSMFEMNFDADQFDLIWSEGAIYVMGFGEGLRRCYRFLKPGGSMVVSELSWLSDNPPREAREYWATNYPQMQSIDANVRVASQAGFVEARTFILPVADWWMNYYGPAEARMHEVRRRHAEDPKAISILDEIAREYDLFRKYSEVYGYVFYITRK